jgi:glycosyltransferase involved in cell wall biosynthesis
VDLNKFRPGQKKDVFTVAFVGRLSYQKGFDILADLIRCVNTNIELRESFKFFICGTGPYYAVAENLGKRFSNVKFLGYTSEDELIKVYQRSHVLLAPSRYEEFPFTPIEAQACGTPVVVSDIHGSRETVLNRITGLLIKPSLMEFLHATLYFRDILYENPNEYYEYCRNARKNASRYEWCILVKDLEKNAN